MSCRAEPPRSDNRPVDVQSADRVEPFTTKDGSTIRELHHTELQSLAEATLEPSQATERHYHRATEEIYFVLEGRGRVVLEGATETLEAGEAIVAPAGATHGIANDGTGRLTVLVVVTPPPPHA